MHKVFNFAMHGWKKKKLKNHRSETHRNEGFQQVKDFTVVEVSFENHRSETDRNEGFFNNQKTSPWLEKILKIIDLKRTELRFSSIKRLHHGWRKFWKS